MKWWKRVTILFLLCFTPSSENIPPPPVVNFGDPALSRPFVLLPPPSDRRRLLHPSPTISFPISISPKKRNQNNSYLSDSRQLQIFQLIKQVYVENYHEELWGRIKRTKMGLIQRQVFPVCESLCFFCPALRARSRHPVKRYKKLLAEIFPRSPVIYLFNFQFFSIFILSFSILGGQWKFLHRLIV